MAIPVQLKMFEKLLEQKSMGIPDTRYLGPKLVEDPRYGRACGNIQLAKTLPCQCTIDQIPEQREQSSWPDRISRGRRRSYFGQKT